MKNGGYAKMEHRIGQTGKWQAFIRKTTALTLLVALLVSLTPAAFAAIDDTTLQSIYGFSLADRAQIALSTPKVYIKTMRSILLHGSGTTKAVDAGTWIQMVAKSYFNDTATGDKRALVFYDNARWETSMDGIFDSVQTSAQLTDYVVNTLWVATSFGSLNKDLKLEGDVRVHGLQYALQLTGFYTGVMDGQFGSGTESAVRNFQRTNKLTVDGRAGPQTQIALYTQALTEYRGGKAGDILNGSSVGTSTTTPTTPGGVVSTTGTVTTNVEVNLRKSTSTSSARLGIVPKNTTLTYTDTHVSGSVTWYKVVYNGKTGWLMGTFLSGGSSGSTSTGSGTLSIIKSNTRVRKTPNGAKTGYVLSIGSSVTYSSSSTAGGYTWYHIRMPNGTYGYVRGDCVSVTGSTGGTTTGGTTLPSSTKTYLALTGAIELFTTEERPAATAAITVVPAGTILQMVSPTPYTKGGVQYCSVFYNNVKYNTLYGPASTCIMTPAALSTYIVDNIWKAAYTASLKVDMKLEGDVRVHAAQMALSVLGFYTGALDGNYGSGTSSAVRNFQRKNNLSVDGSIGPQTWIKLFPMALAAYTGTTTGGTGTPAITADFGTVKSVEKASWSVVNNDALFPKSSSAKVMDTQTGLVFTIFRWSGGNHADCVPYSTADTKIMCDIVNFPYNSSKPSSSQLTSIKNSGYTWPHFTSSDVGSKWDRRPGLLNVNGRVFAVSIYGWPHGFNDIAKAKRDGQFFHDLNNYYGMMCVHFVGSTTHSSTTPDSGHQASIETAYAYAKTRWPSLCK